MIITGDDMEAIVRIKEQLKRLFEMKDLGKKKYLLGIEVAFSRRGYLLSLL